jgi:hypothetical protein
LALSAVLTDYPVLTHYSTHTQSQTTAIAFAIDDRPNACNSAAQLTAGFVVAPSIVPATIL